MSWQQRPPLVSLAPFAVQLLEALRGGRSVEVPAPVVDVGGHRRKVAEQNARSDGGRRMARLVRFVPARERFGILETTGRRGEEPPDHVHDAENELFFILDGEVTFRCGTERFTARRHSFVFLPQQVQHGYSIESPEAHMLIISSPSHFVDRVEREGRSLE